MENSRREVVFTQEEGKRAFETAQKMEDGKNGVVGPTEARSTFIVTFRRVRHPQTELTFLWDQVINYLRNEEGIECTLLFHPIKELTIKLSLPSLQVFSR